MQFEHLIELADKDKDGILDSSEIHSLFKKINLNMSKSAIKSLVEKYNSAGLSRH